MVKTDDQVILESLKYISGQGYLKTPEELVEGIRPIIQDSNVRYPLSVLDNLNQRELIEPHPKFRRPLRYRLTNAGEKMLSQSVQPVT